ncbi:VCBS repeat-containing protein [Seonamhaeicola sp. S2-3]|uniref:FG-GAP repeat domain-containing protein n=1 Tax=Seonamhaeicola sp. S2-3 TaxID=1936081 RepID=UPI0018DE8040|nr:VCBS repeat-containing protein [Seonamhaeicola sp. S2-3]
MINRFLTTWLILVLLVSKLSAQNTIWKRHTIDASLSGADGVKITDVNNDGLPDITTGWEEGGYTKVYLHPGFNLVKQNWPSVIVGKTPNVEDAVFADLDNNGALDVVSSTEGHHNKIYFNWAPSNLDDYLNAEEWKSQVLPASDKNVQWMYCVPMDIDGKNGIDLVVGSKNKNAEIGWFQSPKNSRKLSKWKWFSISPATWVMSMFSKDMDGDGDLDIVVSDRKPGPTQGVRWLENPRKIRKQKKTWKNHFIGCQGLEVMFMDLKDLDGDGLEDVIVTEATTRKIWFLKRMDKTGLNWKPFPIAIPEYATKPKSVVVGDLDNDGKPDLVHSFEKANGKKEGIYWLSYKNKPTDSVWEWHTISGPKGIKYDKIELVDLDGDGDLDVLTCEENYGADSEGLGVIWYENPLNEI